MARNVLDHSQNPPEKMHALLQHLRYTLRLLRKSPGFTLTAVLIVAFGIGVNTAMFSLIDTALLQPLPYPNPDRLVEVCMPYQKDMLRWPNYPAYLDLAAGQHTFDSLAAETYTALDLAGNGEAQRIEVHFVSASLPAVSKVPIVLGRWFTKEEDIQHGPLVAVLSEPFWKSRFQSDPNIIGKTITISDFTFQVIGVAPIQANNFAPWQTDVFAPINAVTTVVNKPLSSRSHSPVDCIARLKPGVTLSQAEADLKTIQANLATRYPDTDADRGVRLVPLRDRVVIDYSGTIWLVGGAAACLLLISCANVANLLYTRAVERGREMNIRSALGATRRRLVGQLLLENAFLSFFGGVVGVLIAWWLVRLIRALSPSDVYRLSEISINANALWFVLVLTALVALFAALLPAWKISRVDLASALKAEGGLASTTGSSRQRSQSTLVVAQVALASVLLIGAGLLARSYLSAQSVPLGFNPQGVLTAPIHLTSAKYAFDKGRTHLFWDELLAKTRQLPGVEAASLNDELPLMNGYEVMEPFTIDGQADPGPGHRPVLDWQMVSADYFRLLEIPLLEGRAFDDRETTNTESVIMVDAQLAQRYFPGLDPIGKVVKVDGRDCRIIGVVPHVQYMMPGDEESAPQAYFSYKQWNDTYETLILRSLGDPASLLPALRKAIASIDPNVAIDQTRTYNGLISERLSSRKLSFILVGVFSGAALFLSAIGLYATLAYAVSLRTREIGIRIALGATSANILRLVTQRGLTLVSIGLAIGILIALVFSRSIESVLYEVSGTDPVTLGVAVFVLCIVAAFASLLPARRAARIDPVVALRQ
jgi:putative ABC transport system permease protein